MCYAKPRPRCKEHVQKKITSRTTVWQEALDRYGPEHPKTVAAKTLLSNAIQELDSTEGGQKDLKQLMVLDPENESLAARQRKGELTYKLRMLAGEEDDEGRPAALSRLFASGIPYYDADETASIMNATREMSIKVALRKNEYDDSLIPANEYHAMLDALESRIKDVHGEVPEEEQSTLAYLRSIEAPAKSNMESYTNFDRSLITGKKQLEEEIVRVAALQGVPPKVAAAFYEGYRDQYNRVWAGHPSEQRPDPPQHWVEGTLSGYRHSYNTALAPSDPASMYALYKMRADPNAIPQAYKVAKRNYVAVNLITADLTNTAKSRKGESEIIGVSMVEYTPEGAEVSKYHTWVKPSDSTIKTESRRIAAEQNLNTKNLINSPSWSDVEADIVANLKGRTILTSQQQQTVNTLNSNMKEGYKPGWAAIDVTDVATKHFSQMNTSLATSISTMRMDDEVRNRQPNMEALTVGEVFFEQQKKLRASWNKKESRKIAPNLTEIPYLGRWAGPNDK